MYKICILTVYFGKLPIYFNQWLKSCVWNPAIDFLIVTDQDICPKSQNVQILKTSLGEIKKRFDKIMNDEVALDFPYKLCDYKPMYGLAFEPELQGYDFWGHCDIDLIWGDLSKFITNEILDYYDKIYPLGHLSLYRNTKEVNNYFRLPGSLRGDISKVIKTNKSCVFDERYGIDKIFEYNSLPIYSKEEAADICFLNQRMIIASTQIQNYRQQAFLIKDGKCLRAYIDKSGKIMYDEFAYIHLQKRQYFNTIDEDTYIVSQNKFLPLESPITSELIESVNPSVNPIIERLEYIVKDCIFRFKRKYKQLLIN